ncbi:MBL fold metallo-hydrolase [Pendulispora rubella]|uniref:MBL fold metallo-hydrolase n=1 Tax=Pendulispora rubella TaxID=2741070 RepID=A0ABZ2L7K7_9BACT
MWYTDVGCVDEDLIVLGTIKNPVFLTGSGDDWALIEGGLTRHAPLVLRQLQDVLGDTRRIRRWLVTHSHYDHCGLLGQLYPYMPWVTVYASPETAKAFQSERARAVVQKINDATKLLASPGEELPALPNPALPPAVLSEIPITTVVDGDRVELDGRRSMLVRKTPGHSRCQIAYFDESRGRAFVSDALGELVEEGYYCPLSFDDLAAYRTSIESIAKLGAEEVVLGHHGRLTGEQAARAAAEARDGLERFADDARKLLPKAGGAKRTVAEQLSQRLHAPSVTFVPQDLHVQSMLRILDLLESEHTLT